MKAQHTPGPWAYHESGAIVLDANGNDLVDPFGGAVHDRRGVDEKAANARLIAAAPDLLKALEGAVHFLADLNGSEWIKGDDAGSADMRQRAKAQQGLVWAAITKAEG